MCNTGHRSGSFIYLIGNKEMIYGSNVLFVRKVEYRNVGIFWGAIYGR